MGPAWHPTVAGARAGGPTSTPDGDPKVAPRRGEQFDSTRQPIRVQEAPRELPLHDPPFRHRSRAGAAAAASLVVTAPTAVADQPQTKLMRLLDECDKETFDVGLPGLCTVDAGSVTFDRFSADLQRGGSGAWWINNRKETIDAGDS